jgi:glycosyltransferase involved in cell wall biosynthesis
MTPPLVTLITPCYNGEKHLANYMEGVLSQTYCQVQYIFINDGSSDRTEEMILSRKADFIKKGWDFLYLKQKNAGPASAINNALKHIRGKYFSQIDSDDILLPDFLKKYSGFLERNPDCGFCYAAVGIAKETKPKAILRVQERVVETQVDNLFSDIILGKNLPPLPFYMMNTEKFMSVIENKSIWCNDHGKSGQNWQMLLPMAYNYKCGYLRETLAIYVERKNSHTPYMTNDALKATLFNTISLIKSMPDAEKIFWYSAITEKFALLKLAKPSSQWLKLFGILPILQIRNKGGRIIYRLFGFIPIVKAGQ